MGQVCIGWALRKHVAVATKTEKEYRMKENLGSIEVASKLTKVEIKQNISYERSGGQGLTPQ